MSKKKKGFFASLFEKLDKKLEKKSKTKQCSCCAKPRGKTCCN